jgi:SAM-dependent methyltransferase
LGEGLQSWRPSWPMSTRNADPPRLAVRRAEGPGGDGPACSGAERHELRLGGRRVGHGKAVFSRRAGGHDGGVADDGGADWAGYYASSAGREPRPLLLAACQELGAGQDRLAIDLGCGEGTDALELLARGWLVLAVDAEPAGLALLRARIPPAAAGRIRVLCASFAEAELPCAQLIHAGFSLPFCPPQEFPALWARIRRALAPGGVFAGQLFGTRDTWADDPDMTFHARHQAETLLDGLDILRLEETERDGHAFSGPKHWHTFDILARKPVSRHPSAPASR